MGTKLEPNWDQTGTKMGPKWHRNEIKRGTKLGPNWNQTGTKMGPKWDQNETKMGPKCNQNGTKMGPKWVANGSPGADGTCGAPMGHRGPKKCLKCVTVVKNRLGHHPPAADATRFWDPLGDSLKEPIRTLSCTNC